MENQLHTQEKSNDVFSRLISPALQYIGLIGAIIMSIAYIAVVVVLIVGFKAHTMTTCIVFALVNSIMGLLILQCLKLQGTKFAKNKPENKDIIEEYYNSKTKDKKFRSIKYYWITSTIIDVVFKGLTFAFSIIGIIYIVIAGSKDYSLLLFALVNLLMFTCFGFLGMNKAYEFYNNRHIPYMKEQIKIIKGEKENEQKISRVGRRIRSNITDRVQQKEECSTGLTDSNTSESNISDT